MRLPSGWQWESINELAAGGTFVDGDWVETKDQAPEGPVRLTQLADVGVAEFRDRSDRWMRTDQAERLGCTRLRHNDILIARMPEPLGRACLVPATIGEAVTAVDVAILRLQREDLEPRYLMWALNAPDSRRQIVAMQSGTTRKRISRRNLGTVRLPVPSLREQRRVVDILEDHLSRLDAAESGLTLAATRTDRWELSALWKVTHAPGSPPVRLDSIAEVKLGRQRSPKNHAGARMRPYLRAANVHWNRLRLDDIKEMNFSEAEEATFGLQRGDILVVEASGSAAEVGKSAIFSEEVPGACFQNTLLRVRCKSSLPGFVQKYLLAEALAGRLVQESRGVGIHHIGRARLAALPIVVPDEAAQARMAEAAGTVLAASERVREQIAAARSQAQALRQALLAAAFTGRLTGGAPDEEVVQELAGV